MYYDLASSSTEYQSSDSPDNVRMGELGGHIKDFIGL